MFVIQVISCMTVGLNNKLLPGILNRNKWKFAIQQACANLTFSSAYFYKPYFQNICVCELTGLHLYAFVCSMHINIKIRSCLLFRSPIYKFYTFSRTSLKNSDLDMVIILDRRVSLSKGEKLYILQDLNDSWWV